MRRIMRVGLVIAMAVVLVPADVSGQDVCELRCVDGVCTDAVTQIECFPPYELPEGGALDQVGEPEDAASADSPQGLSDFLGTGRWDNGDFDGINALLSSIMYDTRTADDFVVPSCPDEASVEISTATAQIVVFPGVTQAELEIREDAGGQPGALIVDGMASATYTVEQITFFGLPIWGFTWSFIPHLELTPGTYWFTAAAIDELAYWATSNGGPDGAGSSQAYFQSALFGYPNWTPGSVVFGQPYQVAFTITGVCPTAQEPVGGVAVGGIERTANDGGLAARAVEPALPSDGLLPPTIVLIFGAVVVAVLIGSARARRRA